MSVRVAIGRSGGKGWGTRTGMVVAIIGGACWVPADGGRGSDRLETASSPIVVHDFLCDQGLTRVGRQVTVSLWCDNDSDAPLTITGRLDLPHPMRLVAGQQAAVTLTLPPFEEREFRWRVTADAPVYDQMTFVAAQGDRVLARASHPMRFLPAIEVPDTDTIPAPNLAPTEILVGAHHCPLWEEDRPEMWNNILKHPERTPVLGFYAQHYPEVADWETVWAVEHGVSFFIYCWYRSSQGGPVQMRFSSAIHEALFHSRHVDHLRFTIMWENQSRGQAGVADEADLMENLLPFWIENYFQHPSYLKIDNRPVLFIYRPEFLVHDLGGIDQVAAALDKMRQACRQAGFDGLILLGEYRGLDPQHLQRMKDLGLDYTFAYVWPIANDPTAEQAIDAQMNYIRQTQQMDILPQVVTVSQAWSGWHDEGSIWKIPPEEFGSLLEQAKQFIAQEIPSDQLGSRMLLLDNWNEWGEGHYIAPYREYGFGYLDAVHRVFSQPEHRPSQLIPEDLGMGPYDHVYRDWLAHQQSTRRMLRKHMVRPDAPEGLVAWWTFDEPDSSPVTYDYSGHRLGGRLHQIARSEGLRGRSLVCEGGAVLVPADPRLFPHESMTIECWVRTETASQNDRWIVNCVFGQGTSGYRLGFYDGHPTFQIPQTRWSHSLRADRPLPLGRWVHLVGTFDGHMLRIFLDGHQAGALERPGPIHAPSNSPLVLGSFAQDHTAHFQGQLDEVRLYHRALDTDEIQRTSQDHR